TKSATTLCNANRGVIFLRDGEVFRAQASSGTEPELEKYMHDHPLKPGRDAIVPRVALSGSVEHVPDIEADPEYRYPAPSQFSTSRAYLGIPLLREGRIEGVFVLSRREPGPFTARQIELIQTFADQAVIAIENVRLFEQVQAKTRDLSES